MVLRFLLFLFRLVEAGDVVLVEQVFRFVYHRLSIFGQRLRFLASAVHFDDFKGAAGTDGVLVGNQVFVCGVGDGVGQNIGFEEEIFVIHRVQADFLRWQLFQRFHVLVNLIVQAALQLRTLASQFLRVEGDVLETGGAGRYTYKVCHPCGAAQLTAARTDSANASSFLTCTNLLHLYPHSEALGQHFDQLAEVHAFVGDVVEDGFVAVALIFHVANLHLKTQVFGYLAGFYHGLMLVGFRLTVFVHVHVAGFAIDALELHIGFQIGFFHLEWNQAASHRHCSDVMSRVGFHCHDVAFHQVQVVAVQIVTFAGWLELHFHHLAGVVVVG